MKMRSTRHKTEIKTTGIKTNLTLKSNIHDNTEVQDENENSENTDNFESGEDRSFEYPGIPIL